VKIDYSQLGKNIAKYRKFNGLTQEKLAEFIDLSSNHVSNIENNHSIPSLETLVKICEVLNITPDVLLLGTVVKHGGTLKDAFVQKLPMCSEKQLLLLNNILDCLIENKIE
jgi:transcriptional regulator with XRE-family HTH domain